MSILGDDSELTFGDLDLRDGEPYLARDGSVGNPSPLTSALPRLLLDGEVVSGRRSSNRELSFEVLIFGDDHLALAEAEAALALEVDKARNELRWKSIGMNTPATVYETFRGRMSFIADEDAEMNGVRRYAVTLPALPYARSVNVSTVTGTRTNSGNSAVWSLSVPGSMRTPGTLTLSASTTTGDVLIITAPDLGVSFNPELRAIDASQVTTATVAIPPGGPYALIGYGSPLNPTTAPGSLVTMSLADGSVVRKFVKRVAPYSDPKWITLGVVSGGIAGNSADISGATFSGVFAVPLDTGSHLAVRGVRRDLWVESPSIDQPFGGVWTSDDGHPGVRSYARPLTGAISGFSETLQFTPGAPGTRLFVVTSGHLASDVTMGAEVYARWHTHAAS